MYEDQKEYHLSLLLVSNIIYGEQVKLKVIHFSKTIWSIKNLRHGSRQSLSNLLKKTCNCMTYKQIRPNGMPNLLSPIENREKN